MLRRDSAGDPDVGIGSVRRRRVSAEGRASSKIPRQSRGRKGAHMSRRQ